MNKKTNILIKKAKKPKITLRGRKKAMFNALIQTLGNITKSAEKVGIDRTTHYDWLEKDADYKEMVAHIDDYQLDFYESALNLLVKEKNPAAIIFALKCKGKKRNWIERQEISHTGKFDVNHTALTKQEKQELLEDLSNE